MRLRFSLLLLILVQLTLLTGCDKTPTGRSQLALVPHNMMAQMGEDAFEQLLDSQPISGDAATNALVQCVEGGRCRRSKLPEPRFPQGLGCGGI